MSSVLNTASDLKRPAPRTLWVGLLIILACEALLFTDVLLHRRGPFHTQTQILAYHLNNPPTNSLAYAARFVAFNITAIAWVGYLLFLDGVFVIAPWPKRGGTRPASPIRSRPHHFALLCLASIFIWCIFDTVNFYSIRAWRYIGMPPDFSDRAPGYFLAFATIVPGMLLSAQILLNAGLFNWARKGSERSSQHSVVSSQHGNSPSTDYCLLTTGYSKPNRLRSSILILSLLSGLAMFLWPLLHADPITNLTLWASLVFLLDPINYWLGRPSMWRDWFNGNFARTLAAFSGGLICGFLWEFWNYWALTKWVYHLPFLGPWEHVRYFEMPLPGLIGFLPFGLECWVIWQTMRIALDGLAEPLPDDMTLL